MPLPTFHAAPRAARRHQAGLGLIELMVALVLGMLTVLIVLQVFTTSEANKRSIIGGDDANSGGVLALASLQRDLRQAGYGLGGMSAVGCNVLLPSGRTLAAVAPVTINAPAIPAGDANTDTLTVAYGSAAGAPEGNRVTAQPGAGIYAVVTPTAFAVNDLVLAVPPTRPSPCVFLLEAVTTVSSPSPAQVTVTTGTVGMSNGRLFNFGNRPRLLAYAIRGGNLTVCDMFATDCTSTANVGNPAIWVPVGGNIVSLRAQYGRDTSAPMDGAVDVYDRSAPTTACAWARISALRLAIVARSAQFERTAVTAAAPTWAGSAEAAIDLSALPDWQQFRYRTFETTMPLRNITWQGAQAGC